MKREYWIGLVIVAMVIGVLVGYSLWGGEASQAAELQTKVQQLMQENADLKSQLPASGAAPTTQEPGPGTTAPPGMTTPPGSTEEKPGSAPGSTEEKK